MSVWRACVYVWRACVYVQRACERASCLVRMSVRVCVVRVCTCCVSEFMTTCGITCKDLFKCLSKYCDYAKRTHSEMLVFRRYLGQNVEGKGERRRRERKKWRFLVVFMQFSP